MSDIESLLDVLQDLVDDKRERVVKLFADIRASVPRPMTLVYITLTDGSRFCSTRLGDFWYGKLGVNRWCGNRSEKVWFEEATEPEIVAAMQSHFNAAWESMTAKGAAT